MIELLESPVFGIALTLIALELGIIIQKKSKISLLNPLMMAIIIIIAILQLGGIEYETYNNGGAIITFFLAPTTVILAVPLYRKFDQLKKNALPILIGVFIGSAVNITLILVMAKMIGLDSTTTLSLVPKSVTTPIGISLSNQLGGIAQITVGAIIVTGITGAIVAPTLFRILKIEDKVAKGVAIGTSAHALGTVKAMEMGETEGAMSGLAIGVAGLITVFIAPVLVAILY